MLHSASAWSKISRASFRIAKQTEFSGESGGDGGVMRHDYMRESMAVLAISVLATCGRQLLLQPAFHGHAHLVEVAREEMVAGNKHQFLGIGCVGHDHFQRLVRAKWS